MIKHVDVLFLIRARLDSGRAKGAAQLTKDIRVLKKSEEEIMKLRDVLEDIKKWDMQHAMIHLKSGNGKVFVLPEYLRKRIQDALPPNGEGVRPAACGRSEPTPG